MKSMSDDELITLLAEKVMCEGKFRDKLVRACLGYLGTTGKKTKNSVIGKLKSEFERYFAEYRRKKQKEIEEEASKWLKEQFANRVSKLRESVSAVFDDYDARKFINGYIKEAVREEIKNQLMDMQVSMRVGDIFEE